MPASSVVSPGASAWVSARSVTVSTHPTYGPAAPELRLAAPVDDDVGDADGQRDRHERDDEHEPVPHRGAEVAPGAGEPGVVQAAHGGDPRGRADPLAGLQHPTGRPALARRH